MLVGKQVHLHTREAPGQPDGKTGRFPAKKAARGWRVLQFDRERCQPPPQPPVFHQMVMLSTQTLRWDAYETWIMGHARCSPQAL